MRIFSYMEAISMGEMQQKQIVQWFPGHMAKTRRLIKESLSLVDAVTEIVDARIPESSRNPELAEMIGDKPLILLLNKSDLADKDATKQWLSFYRSQGVRAVAADCKSGSGLNAYRESVKQALAEKIKSNAEKGMAGRPLRIMVVGIPNTGKSSFINKMAGKNRAKVADKPGVTRQNQWFAIGDGMELLDTPGVLWPKFEDPAVGDKLAFIGSVKNEVFDPETLALRLIDVLAADYSAQFSQRYKLEKFDISKMENYEILELVGRKRGMLISGGEIDTLRAANMILDEYKGGKFGKLTLERPQMSEDKGE